MKTKIIVTGVAVLGAVAAALALPASASKVSPAPVSPLAGDWGNPTGGGLDMRPRLVQGSVFSGTTGTGTRPEVLFWARNVSAQNVEAVADRLRESASFADEQG